MKHQYQLKRDEVNRIIGSQELKKWWVAEFTGVHKTTLRRWLQGKIHTVRGEHAEQLAQVLQARLSEIADPVAKRNKTRTVKNQ